MFLSKLEKVFVYSDNIYIKYVIIYSQRKCMNYFYISIIYLIILNLIGIVVMWLDKVKAQGNAWRIPEKSLFLVSLIGGSIGDVAIIGANTVVGCNVEPYTILIGNPAKILRKRFDDELIDILLDFKWWNKSIDEIQELIPILTGSDLEKVKKEITARLKK